MNKTQKAFTLIELLVVIAIIGILSGFIVVSMNGATNSAHVAKAQIFANSLRNSLSMNIVGEWRFDGPTSSESIATADDVKDTWGSNNGSIIGGSEPIVKSSCVFNKCLRFNSANSNRVVVNDSATLDISGEITIGVWFKADTIGKFHTLVSKGADDAYNLRIRDTNVVQFYFNASDSSGLYDATSTNTISADTWYYIVGVYNGAIEKVYVNGVEWGTRTVAKSIATNNVNLWIGGRTDGWAPGWTNGTIDDVRVFDKAMPISQIKEEYYAGLENLLSSGGIDKNEYQQRIAGLETKTAK